MSVLGAVTGHVYSFWQSIYSLAFRGSENLDKPLQDYADEPPAPRAFSFEVRQYIDARFSQLKSSYEDHLLSDSEILRTATFIETQVLSSDLDHEYFKKSEEGAARTLFYQKDAAIFLVNKSKAPSLLDKKCACKRVCSAVKIPFARMEPCVRVAQGVNRDEGVPYSMICREIDILKAVQGRVGIIQLEASFLYRPTRAAIFWEYCPQDFGQLTLKANHPIAKDTVIGYCVQLIQGLQFLHSKGIIHGDLKINSAFLDQSALNMLLSDFGFSFYKNDPSSRPPFLAYGYGTLLHAAPELLVGNADAVDYEKAEVWALGMVFYMAYFGAYPIWLNLTKLCSANMVSLQHLHKEIVSCLRGFAQYQTYDPFVRLIYQMIHEDPLKRPSLAECLKRAQKNNTEVVQLAKELGGAFKDHIGPNAALDIAEMLLRIKVQFEKNDRAKKELANFCQMPLFSKSPLRVSHLLAFMLARHRQKRGFAVLLTYAPVKEGWLKELLPSAQDPATTQEIYEAILSLDCTVASDALLAHIKVLNSLYVRLRHARCGFSDAECLSISIFASLGMEPAGQEPGGYYQAAEFGLPADIQYTGEQIYVRTRDRRAYGTYKRMIPGLALTVRDSSPGRVVALLVNRSYRKKHVSQLDRIEERYELMCLDVEFQKLFYGLEPKGVGIWPLGDFRTFRKTVEILGKPCEIPKVSVETPFGVTLKDLISSQVGSDTFFDTFLEVACQMAVGLNKLHSNGFFHGDLDDDNIICEKDPLFVGLNDFGFVVREDTPQNQLPGSFDIGYYGKIYPTAPELLGNTAFTGDYKAVEMWAFAYLLYKCFYGHRPPWAKILDPYSQRFVKQQIRADLKLQEVSDPKPVPKEDAQKKAAIPLDEPIPVSQEDVDKIKLRVQETIDMPEVTRQMSQINLRQSPTVTPETMAKRLIKKCFRLEPKMRPTIAQFLQEMQQIQAIRSHKK